MKKSCQFLSILSACVLVLITPLIVSASVIAKRFEFKGVITTIHFPNPLKEAPEHLADFEVEGLFGKTLNFRVNLDTIIFDPLRRKVWVAYLNKKQKVKVVYLLGETHQLIAVEVYVNEDSPSGRIGGGFKINR